MDLSKELFHRNTVWQSSTTDTTRFCLYIQSPKTVHFLRHQFFWRNMKTDVCIFLEYYATCHSLLRSFKHIRRLWIFSSTGSLVLIAINTLSLNSKTFALKKVYNTGYGSAQKTQKSHFHSWKNRPNHDVSDAKTIFIPIRKLEHYFNGPLQTFCYQIHWNATPFFYRKVWSQLRNTSRFPTARWDCSTRPKPVSLK